MKVFCLFIICVVIDVVVTDVPCWGATSRPVERTSPRSRAPDARRTTVPPPRRAPQAPQPWTLNTSIPLYVAGGGGLLITSIGLIGFLSEPTDTPIPGNQPTTTPTAMPSPVGVLFFSGLSVMASSVSAALWRGDPKQWMAVLGSVMTGGIALAGGLLVGVGQDTLTLSMGWGFLASLPVHIIFNIVGWFNVRHHQIIKESREKADDPTANLSPPSHFRVHVSPSFIPHGAGIQLVGQF